MCNVCVVPQPFLPPLAFPSYHKQNAAAFGQLETLQPVRNGQLGKPMFFLISLKVLDKSGASSLWMEGEPLNGSVQLKGINKVTW